MASHRIAPVHLAWRLLISRPLNKRYKIRAHSSWSRSLMPWLIVSLVSGTPSYAISRPTTISSTSYMANEARSVQYGRYIESWTYWLMWTWATFYQLAESVTVSSSWLTCPTWSDLVLTSLLFIYTILMSRDWTWPLASARFDHYHRRNIITSCSNSIWLRQLSIASHSSEFQYISLDHLLGRYMHMYMYLAWYRKDLLISSYSYIPLTTLLDHCISSNNHKTLSGTPIPLVAGPYFPPSLSLSLTTHCVDYLVTYSITRSHRYVYHIHWNSSRYHIYTIHPLLSTRLTSHTLHLYTV